jgi:hypothetical protein
MAKKKIIKEEEKVVEKTKELVKVKTHSRDKQALMLLGGFLVLILIAVLILMTRGGSNTFVYDGLKITKSTQGSVTFYSTNVPVYGSFGQLLANLTVDFQTNPKNFKNIPFSSSKMILERKTVYISFGDLRICEDNGIAAGGLGLFLSQKGFAMMGIKIKGALSNESSALAKNMTYADCQTNPNDVVVLIRNGNETKIEQTTPNCYQIESKNCEILNATEKFEFEILKVYAQK